MLSQPTVPHPPAAVTDTAIVIPVHDALEYTQRTLTAIVETYPRVPLVVVDDQSNEETQSWLARFLGQNRSGEPGSHRVLLRNERQQLFTRTVNRGIRCVYQLRCEPASSPVEFVAVVNTDVELWDGWLKALRHGMSHPAVGIVGFAEIPDGLEPAYREIREPEYVSGHCFLLRVKMLEEIGVFCETDLRGTEDTQELTHLLGQAHVGSDRVLSWRANRAGWKTQYCHCMLCDHAGGGSWHHDLAWLTEFDLQPLWPPCDHLINPGWEERARPQSQVRLGQPARRPGAVGAPSAREDTHAVPQRRAHDRPSHGAPQRTGSEPAGLEKGPALTVIIPSISAPTLASTLASIRGQELRAGDQILVVGDGPQQLARQLVEKEGPPFHYLECGPEHDWGNPQRNYALQFATGDYLAWMDEDDVFLPGIFSTIRRVARENRGRPIVFRFIMASRHVLWQKPGLIQRGHIGGHQWVAPNAPGKVGLWGTGYEADFDFIRSTLDRYHDDEVCVWRQEIIAKCRPHLP